jgi:hypothetical protein
MHPAMLKVLAAEHARDLRVRAAKAQRGRDARRARRARRAHRGAEASPGLLVPRPRLSAECSKSAMEH